MTAPVPWGAVITRDHFDNLEDPLGFLLHLVSEGEDAVRLLYPDTEPLVRLRSDGAGGLRILVSARAVDDQEVTDVSSSGREWDDATVDPTRPQAMPPALADGGP